MMTLAADAARLVQVEASTIQWALGIVCTMIISALVLAYRLGSKVSGFGLQVAEYQRITELATEHGEKWNTDMLAAMREIDGAVQDLRMQYAEVRNEAKTAHRVVDKVQDHEKRLVALETSHAMNHPPRTSGPVGPYVVSEGAPSGPWGEGEEK